MSKIVDCFYEACEKYKERIAFFDLAERAERKKNFEELRADVDRVYGNLLAKGMKRKERVMILIAPSYELLVFMIACMKIGASLMIVDMWAGKTLVRKTFEEYRADYVAVSGKTKLLRLAFPEIRKIKKVIFIEKIFAETSGKIEEKEEIQETEAAVLTMTTGSTGRPKIILRSHGDLYRQLELVRNNMTERSGETLALNTSFMYHFVNILNGYSGILLPVKPPGVFRFFYQQKLKRIRNLSVQVLFTTPDFCMETENLFPALEELYVGGAILNLYEAEKIRYRFSKAKITYIYGATECNLITKTNLDDYIRSLKEENRTVLGKAVKGVSIKTDESGEIMVHADVVLTDYLNPEHQRGEIDEEGRYWHRTGDAGRVENGILYYWGRRDVFVRGKSGDLFSNELEQEVVRTFDEVKKCAFFYHKGSNYLLVEGEFGSEEVLRNFVKGKGIEEDIIIKCRMKIPCDAKHHTKIHYNRLKQMAEQWSER